MYFSQKSKEEIREKSEELSSEIKDQTLLIFSRITIFSSYMKHADMWKLCNASHIVLLENSIITANLTFASCHIKCNVSMTLNTTLPEGESVFSRSSYFRRLIHRQFLILRLIRNREGSLVLRPSVHQVSTSSMCLPSSYSTFIRWTYDE